MSEQLAKEYFADFFFATSGRATLQEHSVTTCKADKNSGRGAFDGYFGLMIAIQQVSRKLAILRLDPSLTMPVVLLCGLWV